MAQAIYGADTDVAEQWAKKRRDELDEGNLDAILAALRLHATSHNEARTCLDYIRRNRSRMRYPEFRSQGLCVTSGVVEAGFNLAIGTRLKRAGMHRTLAGAAEPSSPYAAPGSAADSKTSPYGCITVWI